MSRSRPLPSAYSDRQIYQIGDQPLIFLKGEYDPDQLWFGFLSDRAFFACAKPPETPAPQPLQLPKKDKKKTPSSGDRVMFRYTKGLEQLTLPFWEHRQVSKRQYEKIKESRWAGWEKTDGVPCRVQIRPGKYRKAKSWLEENCQGRYYLASNVIVFELALDAMMVKLSVL